MKSNLYMRKYYHTFNKTTEQAKTEYLNYIQSLMDDLQNLKDFASDIDIDSKNLHSKLFACESKLMSLNKRLNAEKLYEWHECLMSDVSTDVNVARTARKLKDMMEKENIQFGQDITPFFDKYNISIEDFEEYNAYVGRK